MYNRRRATSYKRTAAKRPETSNTDKRPRHALMRRFTLMDINGDPLDDFVDILDMPALFISRSIKLVHLRRVEAADRIMLGIVSKGSLACTGACTSAFTEIDSVADAAERLQEHVGLARANHMDDLRTYVDTNNALAFLSRAYENGDTESNAMFPLGLGGCHVFLAHLDEREYTFDADECCLIGDWLSYISEGDDRRLHKLAVIFSSAAKDGTSVRKISVP